MCNRTMFTLFVCVSIGSLIFWSGLGGLLLDAIGALLLVVVDISAFDSLWSDNENMNQADLLRQARRDMFQGNDGTPPQLEKGDEGFESIKEIILKESGTELDPIRIYAKPPGTMGAGGNVFIYEGEDIDEPHGGVGSHNLVDGWIRQEIESLEKKFRDRYRKRGMQLLLTGFVIQILSYLLRNSAWLQNFLVNNTPC